MIIELTIELTFNYREPENRISLGKFGLNVVNASRYEISNAKAIANLKKFRKLRFSSFGDGEIESPIALLENFTSFDLEEIQLTVSDINRYAIIIKQFINLKYLTVFLFPYDNLVVNISTLSQIRDSKLIQIKIHNILISLEPEAISDVVGNFRELKVITFCCQVGLKESISLKLVDICKRENRSTQIILCGE